MLNPNDRSLLIDAVRPPPGYRFVAGSALTYTLDLTTLLTIPLHLAVLGSGRREELLKDPVALLEALRRTTSKLAIVCQQGRIAAPGVPHVLYGLLEGSVIEVNAPNGGVFHPKVWAIQYEDVNSHEAIVRMVVLSRNLTPDRCWDLSLVLEGKPGGRVVAANRPIADLLGRVPSFAARPVSEGTGQVLAALADLVARTRWDELPAGFEDVRFHVLGLDRMPWKPGPSDRLAVVSPFVRAGALEMLLNSAEEAVALIARPEELARIDAGILRRFTRCLTLHEQAETDDGEDTCANPSSHLAGLHAKAYIVERGWHTTLYMGSANATNASLLAGGNVEVLVELTGKTSKVGGIESLLGADSLQDYLTDFIPLPEPPQRTVEEQAEELLNVARDTLSNAGVRITFERSDEDAYFYVVRSDRSLMLDRVASIRLWPISLPADRAVDASGLVNDGILRFGPVSAASLTGFVAVELRSDLCDLCVCFVLNLPMTGMPEHRDAAVLRTIVANREGFLRYLLMLLRDDGQHALLSELASALGGPAGRWRHSMDEFPLLEELTRAFSREPHRLHSIRRMVEQLLAAPNGHEIVPPEFLEVWKVYKSMLDDPASSLTAKKGASV